MHKPFHATAPMGGYVLAGGRSSRMGQDKALLPLAGHPLIAHAVAKVRRVAGTVHILAGETPGNPSLEPFAPLVFDAHPGCGPIAGLEAALLHSGHDWNLILPVDLPFLPAAFLKHWATGFLREPQSAIALFRVNEIPQPTLLLLHRAVQPFLTAAIENGNYKLRPILEDAARHLAPAYPVISKSGPYIVPIDQQTGFDLGSGRDLERKPLRFVPDPAGDAQPLWFANLNTPAEFARAARYAGELDPLD